MINPKIYKKLVVKQLSRDFRSAVDIVEMELLSIGKIKPAVDSTEFKRIESIVDAVKYL